MSKHRIPKAAVDSYQVDNNYQSWMTIKFLTDIAEALEIIGLGCPKPRRPRCGRVERVTVYYRSEGSFKKRSRQRFNDARDREAMMLQREERKDNTVQYPTEDGIYALVCGRWVTITAAEITVYKSCGHQVYSSGHDEEIIKVIK